MKVCEEKVVYNLLTVLSNCIINYRITILIWYVYYLR